MDTRGIVRAAGMAAVGAALWLSGCGSGGPDTLIDVRDGKKYKTAKMPDGKTWMAENLNYKTASGSRCYENSAANCDKYGRLYGLNTAMHACPNGWHLPTQDEWENLVNAAGGETEAGKKLKSASGWNGYGGESGGGSDDYGFSALPGGQATTNSFDNIGEVGYWWTATAAYRGDERKKAMYGVWNVHNYNDFASDGADDVDWGNSVRCLQGALYTVTVSDAGKKAFGGGRYPAGATVNIWAGTAPDHRRFKRWMSLRRGDVTFADAFNSATTFTMPAYDVILWATFDTIVVEHESLAANEERPERFIVKSDWDGVTCKRYDTVDGYAQNQDCTFPNANLQQLYDIVKRVDSNLKTELPVTNLEYSCRSTESACVDVDYRYISPKHLYITLTYNGGSTDIELIEHKYNAQSKIIHLLD